VKLEGNKDQIVPYLVRNGIPVVGHVGLTPQTMPVYGMQGKDEASAQQIRQDARALQEAGCFAIVLECIPSALAAEITVELKIPTIGIGAGRGCDGQVLVLTDVLGLTPGKVPPYVKKYANWYEDLERVGRQFAAEVRAGEFPAEKSAKRET